MGKVGRCILLLWLFLATPLLAGTVYYVATNGNDSYNGLYPTYQGGANGPWRTLAKADHSLSAGDTLKIRGGTYNESPNFSSNGTPGSRITITSYEGETAVIDGGYTLPGGSVYYYLVMVSGDYVTLSNVTIKHSSGSLLALTGDYTYAVNVTGQGSRETGMCAIGIGNVFDGCVMTDNGNGYGVNGQASWGSALGAATGAQNCLIQNCRVYDNRGEGINDFGTPNCTIQDNVVYDNGALGIYIGSASGTIVRRNLVYCTAGARYGPSRGIAISSEGGPDPANFQIINNLCLGNLINLECDSDVTEAKGWLIAYNTFVNSQKPSDWLSGGYNMSIYFRPNLVSFSNSYFKNNIIVEDDSRQVPINTTLPNSHPGFVFANNCWSRTPTAAAVGTGDVIADPLLAKTGSTGAGWLTPEWFKILANSPAKDRAAALSEVTEDFFGTARGSAPDIGAHELASTASSLAASATATPTSGLAPLAVSFTGSASGGTSPYTYKWTFGDGGNSASQNPSHTYSVAGSYTATLSVTDSASAAASSTVNINVTAMAALSANLVASPTSGAAPLAVTFTGTAAGGKSPYTYSWAFGDGGTATSQNPSHIYPAAGSYTATLTVTDSASATASASVAITVASTTAQVSLSVAAETGAPATGQGGTTDPAPGNYSYSKASTVSVKSIPNADYRFSKWGGDIEAAGVFSSAATLSLDFNKSVTATFCAKCADVNGDLKITPADAQAAFDIYLGKISNPTWCELENADVKCDGTRLQPKVTPADAQWILNKYLKKGGLDSDCSGNARAATAASSIVSLSSSPVVMNLSNATLSSGGDILIPVVVESATEIDSFGFDLVFPPSALQFIGLESADLTKDFDQLGANVVAYEPADQDQAGADPADVLVLRVGGYKTNTSQNPASGILVTLVFRGTGKFLDPKALSIVAAYDGLRNASFKSIRFVNWEDDSEVRESRNTSRAGKDR